MNYLLNLLLGELEVVVFLIFVVLLVFFVLLIFFVVLFFVVVLVIVINVDISVILILFIVDNFVGKGKK